jgi:hypothetical protein
VPFFVADLCTVAHFALKFFFKTGAIGIQSKKSLLAKHGKSKAYNYFYKMHVEVHMCY